MLKFLFGKKTKTEEKNLIIERFIDEHKALVDLYVEILTLAKEFKFDILKQKLKNFEEILLQHIRDENTHIYQPLDSILQQNSDRFLLKEINQIKSDIVPIKKKINVINLKYRNFNEDNIEDFINVFSYLKEPILNRIELEEKKLFMYFDKKTKKR